MRGADLKYIICNLYIDETQERRLALCNLKFHAHTIIRQTISIYLSIYLSIQCIAIEIINIHVVDAICVKCRVVWPAFGRKACSNKVTIK